MEGSTERPSESENVPPEVLDSRYRLDGVIGRGGMGVVYRAVDLRLGRPVAIKMLRETDGANDERFEAEVRMLAQFSHPNLVGLLDAGDSGGRQYLVMELIDGPTLAHRFLSGVLSLDETAAIGYGVAAALAYVHDAGIVHRDVKPMNVLLDRWGNARLADFGIARLVDTTGLTATGFTLGTPAYLAPEQVGGLPVGPAVDVYALGLVLIECISGHRAFEGTPAEIATVRLHRAPTIPAELDAGWKRVLGSMTAIDPNDRVRVAEAAAFFGDRTRALHHGELAGEPSDPIGDTTILLGAASRPGRRFDQTETVVTPPRLDQPSVQMSSGGEPRRGIQKILLAVVGVAIVGLASGVAFAYFHLGPASSNHGGARDPSRVAISTTRSGSTTSTTPTTTSTTPTTTTTTTTTTLAPVSVASVTGQLVSEIDAAMTSGGVAPEAGEQLTSELQQLALASPHEPPPQQTQQFDQLAEDFDQDVEDGQITGSATTASLTSSLQILAGALGTTVPSTTVLATPSGPGHFGKGHGDGYGHGH